MTRNAGLHCWLMRVAIPLKKDRRERRQVECDGVVTPVQRYRHRIYASEIAHSAAPILFGVRVQDLFPKTLSRNADAIAGSRNWTKVADNSNKFIRRTALAQETENIFLCIVDVDPFKTGRRVLTGMKRGLPPVEVI